MHQDIHYQKGMTCQDCHTTNAWTPAVGPVVTGFGPEAIARPAEKI